MNGSPVPACGSIRVVVPDLFEGEAFDTIDDDLASVERLGFETIIERGVDAARGGGEVTPPRRSNRGQRPRCACSGIEVAPG